MADEEKKLSKKELNKLKKKQAKEAARLAAGKVQQEVTKVIPVGSEKEIQYGIRPRIESQQQTDLQFVDIADLNKSMEGQKVWVRARVYRSRCPGSSTCFLLLRRGLASVQAIVLKTDEVPKEMVKFAAGVSKESIVDVLGTVCTVKNEIASSTQKDVELAVSQLLVVSQADTCPIQVDDCVRLEGVLVEGNIEAGEAEAEDERPRVALKTRLDHRYLDLRAPVNLAIFRLQSAVCQLFREYLTAKQFVEIHTPKLQGNASEGGAEVFEVSYFDGKAYLAQSPQLYKQMAVVSDLEKVFEIAPVFRAEMSFTHRHLCEFMGLDLEMVIQEHYYEVLSVVNEMFKYIFNGLETRFGKELAIVRQTYPSEPVKFQDKLLLINFPQAIQMLRDAGEELEDLEDLSTPHEKMLGRLVKEKYNTDFYAIDRYPATARPFYTMPAPDDNRYTNSYDVFLRGQEISSGAQRVHDPELLYKVAEGLGVDLTPIKHYADAFRYGAFPHGGAGIGLERVVMLYLGLHDIRKSSMFPRDPTRKVP